MYDPPRNGPTLWEIGIPDRTAAEFYVPDPNPSLMNQLYTVQPDKLVNAMHDLSYFFVYLIASTQLSFLETGQVQAVWFMGSVHRPVP